MAELSYMVRREDAALQNQFTSTPPQRLSAPTGWAPLAATYRDGLSLMRGDQLPLLRGDIDRIFTGNTADVLKKHGRTMNLVKRVVYRRAMVYKVFPTFDGPKTLVDALTPDLGGWLKQADRISELCGICWVAPDFQDNELSLTILAPDQVEPIWSGNGDELEALRIYTQAWIDQKLQTLTTTWTPSSWSVMAGNKDVTGWAAEQRAMGGGFKNGINDFGIVPFVPMRPELPMQGDQNGVPNLVLIAQQRVLNLNITYLDALIRLQTNAQAIYKGNKAPAVLKMGMGEAIHVKEELQGQSDFRYELPGVDVQGVWNTIKGELEMIYQEHLGGEWFTLAAAPSGVAMDVNNAGLEEMREDKWDSHRSFWKAFGEVALQLMGVTDSKPLEVKFGSPKVHEDPALVIKRWQDTIAANVARPVEWVMDLHPDWDEAKAQKYYDENVAAAGERAKANRPQLPNPADFMSKNQMDQKSQDMMANKGGGGGQ